MFTSNDIIQHMRLRRLFLSCTITNLSCNVNRTNMGPETIFSPSHKVTFNKNNHYLNFIWHDALWYEGSFPNK